MAIIEDGTKLEHVKADNFINEHVDQFVGIAFASGNELKVAITFGRDLMDLAFETFTAMQGHENAFNTTVPPEAFTLSRLDVAQLSMPLETAKRLRDLLNSLIDAPQPTFIQRSGQ